MARASPSGRSPREQIFRRRLRRFALIGAALGLAPALAFAAPSSPFNPASTQAAAIATLLWFLLILAGVIFVGVEIALFYAIFRFREQPGQAPATFHGNVRVEVVWTALPVLLLALIFVLTVRTMGETGAPPGDPLEVTVVGHQWWWEFDYPQERITTAGDLHVPVGETVVLHVHSVDVIHSFWAPQLAGKQDANPGFSNTITFTATKPGVYDAVCSELCGVQHAWMRAEVVVDTPADYQAWIRAQQTPVPPPTGLAAQGAQLYQAQACDSCHGKDAGPDLSHLMLRHIIGGGVLTNTPENLQRWLADPQAVKPGTKMPNYHFTPSQLQALTAYLETLR